MDKISAHAGEDHDTAAASAEHAVGTQPLLIVPILIVLFAIPLIVRELKPKNKNLPVFIILGELFLVGVLTYSILPVLSIICLSVGFMMAFIFAILGITNGK